MEFLKKYGLWLALVLSLGGYGYISTLGRSNHLPLFTVYSGLFVLFFALAYHFRLQSKWYLLFVCGLLFRLAFFGEAPHLSDDYFRFTWDGELQKDGISAFTFTPQAYATFFEQDSAKREKYKSLLESRVVGPDSTIAQMNSSGYYSIYPAMNQAVFYLSSQLGSANKGNLHFIRFFLLLAEVIGFFVLRALLLQRNMSAGLVVLYWLNPLVIIEIMGNLHFDGMATTFVLLSLFLLERRRLLAAGSILALAIHTKLNPLFVIGAAFNRMNIRSLLIFSLTTLGFTFLLFCTILDSETFWNFKQSFGLYFAWFDFNAGPYYFLRMIGKELFAMDWAAYISLVFPFLTILLFVFICVQTKKYIAQKLLLLYFVYFSFTPVLHPWYLVVLLALGILSQKLYPLLWTFLIFFTYSAYGEHDFNYHWVVYVEFLLVYALFYLESEEKWKRLNCWKKQFFGLTSNGSE